MSGFEAIYLASGIADAVLFISITYLYLHNGKGGERLLTDKELKRRGWLIIALAISLLSGLILVVLALR